jgi:hypothetical protein
LAVDLEGNIIGRSMGAVSTSTGKEKETPQSTAAGFFGVL